MLDDVSEPQSKKEYLRERIVYAQEEMRKQLEAMQVGEHEKMTVMAHNKMTNRVGLREELTPKELLSEDKVSKLVQLNKEGHNVFIGFGKETKNGYVFFDDAKRETIEQMKKDGFRFATVIESSPGNFQGWIRVDQRDGRKWEGTPESRSAVSKALAEAYPLDTGSTGKNHLGRLAGFDNMKPNRVLSDGTRFCALLEESHGHGVSANSSPKVQEILVRANHIMEEKKAQTMHKPMHIASRPRREEVYEASTIKDLDSWWSTTQKSLETKTSDRSSIDFTLCKLALMHQVPEGRIIDMLEKYSDKVREKGKYANNYIATTLNNAGRGITPAEKGKERSM